MMLVIRKNDYVSENFSLRWTETNLGSLAYLPEMCSYPQHRS